MLAEERDERVLCQVELMDLGEELLALSWIRRCLLLLIESIQGRVAGEVEVATIGRKLIAREHGGIIGVVAKAVRKLSNIVPTSDSSRRWRGLPPRQEGGKEGEEPIVLDIEFDANLLEVALNDRLDGKT